MLPSTNGLMQPEEEMRREYRTMNYTYLLKCADDTFYCGWTNELDRRIKAHNDGKGAKYTKGRRPVTLAYYEIFETREEAMRREAAIKKLSRKDKLELAEHGMSQAVNESSKTHKQL